MQNEGGKLWALVWAPRNSRGTPFRHLLCLSVLILLSQVIWECRRPAQAVCGFVVKSISFPFALLVVWK